jgi:hypothetical protein
MDFLNKDVDFFTTLTVVACFVALCWHSNKRNTTVTNDDFDEPKRKRNDVERGQCQPDAFLHLTTSSKVETQKHVGSVEQNAYVDTSY